MAGGAITDYLENKLLEHSVRGIAYTTPTNTYLGLFLVAPTDSTPGTEVSLAGGYIRQQITWGAAASGSIANSATIRFPASLNATDTWGTVVAVGIFDLLTDGNLLWYGSLSSAVTVDTGDSWSVQTGGLTLSLD